jgi:hypothetical protein
MARYFFDVSEGETMVTDDDGTEFEDGSDVAAEAVRTVLDLARDKARKASAGPSQVVMTVRSKGATVMVLSVALSIAFQR